MRFGISTYAFAWSIGVPRYEVFRPMGLKEFYEASRNLGAEVIQVADNMPLHGVEKGERKELLQQAKSDGIGIEVGTRGLRPETLREYLSIASEFESPILRIVIDESGYEPGEEEILQVLRAFLPELEARNLQLAIENHDRFLVSEYVDLLGKLDSEFVGICLDTVNSFGAGEGLEMVLKALTPLTINLHVKDFAIERVPHQMGFVVSGRPAGQGRLPVGEVISNLTGLGRCQSAILENWVIPSNTMEETVREEHRWAMESANFLKELLKRGS